MAGGEDVLVSLWKIKITMTGVRNAFYFTFRLAFLVMGTSVLTLTTSPIVLTDALEHVMSPLKAIEFPAHEIAMMMTIALRFIPTLTEEAQKIMNAQSARGADVETGNLFQRAKAMVPLLVPLFCQRLPPRGRSGDGDGGALLSRRRGQNAHACAEIFAPRSVRRGRDGRVYCAGCAGGRAAVSGESRRVALRVSYDGTNYSGWQRQENADSVQAQVEKALRALTGETIGVTGASRTDAGVHALADGAFR